MEEADFIPLDIIKKIVLPLLTVRNTVIVGISTIGDKSDDTERVKRGAFRKLLDTEGFFKKIEIQLICKECWDVGVRDPCVHRQWDKPSWHVDKFNLKMFEDSPEDDGKRNRELYGVGYAEEDAGFCFSEPLVKRFLNNPRYVFSNVVRNVYIFIDPCAGFRDVTKSMSDYALVSTTDNNVIIGMEAVASNDHNVIEAIILKHVETIRKMDFFSGCRIAVAVEAGTGYENSRIGQLLTQRFDEIFMMQDYSNDKQGIQTTNLSKRMMFENFNGKLKSDTISIARDFVCVNGDPKHLLTEFGKQLERTKIQIIPTNSMTVQAKFTVDGKGENGKEKDDLMMCAMGSLNLINKLNSEPRYKRYNY